MKEKKVKDLMIPLSDYATVSEDDNLVAAVKQLKKAQDDTRYVRKHRAVLAYDSEGKVTGKVSFRCIFKALEPKYGQLENPETIGLSRFGFSTQFLTSLIENLNLWDETLEELVKKGGKRKVKDIMHTPSNGEYVDEEAPVAEAVHQFILGCHQSLLVTKNNQVVGVIRLADLFDLVCEILE
ncbi:CBS domain-containing protein [Desulfospira joergensenii]|uniref:CBS domain-containing protein n=1 Tax=Desulfospira joergensenii TaxID=53329 RepID=UPI0003B74E34|nr:CBS domain-containing protein [Desulfospira joergensenii]